MAQDVLESNQQRKLQPAPLRLFDNIRQVHRRAGIAQRHGHDVPGLVNVKVFSAPTTNVVQITSRLDVPGLVAISRVARFHHFRTMRTIELCRGNSIGVLKNLLAGRGEA